VKVPLALLLGFLLAGFQDDVRLELGRTSYGELDGAPHRVELAFEAAGPVTIELSSFDFDALLHVEDESGAVVVEDDNGGVETNARLVLDTATDGRLFAVVSAKESGVGQYWLVAEPGRWPPEEGTALLEAAIVYRVEAADRALSRGDRWSAAWSRLREGEFRIQRSQYREAVAALEHARDAYREFGERGWEVHALYLLGQATHQLGEWDRALACFTDAVEHYAEVKDERGELGALLNLSLVHETRGELDVARDYCEFALALADRLGDAESRARVLGRRGQLATTMEWERATALLEERLEIARELDPRALMGAHEALGRHYLAGDASHRPLALEHFEQQKVLARELGDAHMEMSALGNQGMIYKQKHEFYRARELHERALEIAQEIGDRGNQVTALGELGMMARELQDLPAALDYAEQAFALCEELGDAVGARMARLGIAVVAMDLGDLERARSILEAQLEEALLADRSGRERLLQLGHLERVAGNTDRALELYLRVAELNRESGRREGVDLFWNLGQIHLSRGEYTEARERFEEGLAWFEKRGNPSAQATCLASLSRTLELTGELARALELLERQLDLARRLGKRPMELACLRRQAGLSWRLGKHPQALELYGKGLGLARELGNEYEELNCLNGHGIVHASLGNVEEELHFYQAARELAVRTGDKDGELLVMGNLGESCHRAEDFEKAHEHYTRALELAAELDSRRRRAWVLGNLSETLFELGELDRSRDLARASLGLYDELQHPRPRLELAALGSLVRIALKGGDVSQSLAHLERGDWILERMRVQSIAAGAGGRGTEPQVVLFWERIAQDAVAARVKHAASSGGSAAADGLRRAGSAKAQSLLAGVVEHRRGARSKGAIRLRRQWGEAVAERQALLERASGAMAKRRPAAGIDRLHEDAERIEAEIDRLAMALRTVSPRDASVDLPEGAGPDELRESVLDDSTLLVEYAEGNERLYAYALTEKELAFLDLGQREEIEEQVEAFLALVTTPSSLGGVRDVATCGAELHRLLLAPALAAAADGVERIVVVPTAPLSGLSFEALVLEAPESPDSFADLRFVIDDYEVSYGPSSPVLVDLASYGPRRSGGKVLLLADPVYPSEPEGTAERPAKGSSLLGGQRKALPDAETFQRLIQTREEALAIADLFVGEDEEVLVAIQRLRQARSGSVYAGLFDLHVGSEASRDKLERTLRPYAVLHLAAHGYVDSQFAQQSGLALASRPGSVGEGFFTIADVLELDLDANLVVLSACDTARGAKQTSEGVESMARAFMYAGARAVVASLWQVADWAAADTMKALYQGALSEGLSPSQALREAKLAIRRSQSTRGVSVSDGSSGGAVESGHPFFWAPFIHIGLPR